MARRVDHSHEELFKMTIDAAKSLVVEQGYRAISIRKIADVIGYAPGTIYNVFKNFDDLMLRVNGQTLDALHGELPKRSATRTVEENIDALVESYLGFVSNNSTLWQALFEHSLPREQELPGWYQDKIERLLLCIDECLEPLFSETPKREQRLVSATLWASLHGISSLAYAGKLGIVSRVSMEEMSRLLVKNFIRGLEHPHQPNRHS
ncbi:TetR/AcrR family transcriptional regulator [Kiloniella laminariae]|uniref:TetR/AcrR family transcriptional regulator n=1 Tax=Kiloniella laminariae TaxID=454162 RepID=A0ABT4LK65_9PROT|nr:TetR/AcrR family transcriptional regulator [Kiloniella laminariae]MCZ4281494.1 TetR/AcrR family transcriptional regulator [Kiloniella laminariae]